MTDRELERKIREHLLQEDETSAIDVAVRGYGMAIQRLIARELASSADPDLVDDAVAETWSAVHKDIATFRGEGAFKTWVSSVAVHTAWRLAARRRRELSRNRSLTPSVQEGLAISPSSNVAWRSPSRVKALQENLDSWTRSVLSSRMARKPWAAIAEKRNTTEDACKSRYKRCIAHLKNLLAGSPGTRT